MKKSHIPPQQVIISPQFFRSAPCQRCAACCKGISLVFTETDVQIIEDVWFGKCALILPYDFDSVGKLLQGLQRFEVEIAGKAKPVWIYPMPASKTCDFLQQKNGQWICSVHAVKPTNCMLPHIWVGFNSKNLRTTISKRPFGSRWMPDCQSVFGRFDVEELENWDLLVLRRMLRNAGDLVVQTYLPEIIEWLESWLVVYKASAYGIEIPRSSICVFGEKSEDKVDSRKFF